MAAFDSTIVFEDPEVGRPIRLYPLCREAFSIVDEGDFERVNGFKWYRIRTGRRRDRFYAYRIARVGDSKKKIYMHRFLMDVEDRNVDVDHKNGCGLDNRRRNLRVCCRS